MKMRFIINIPEFVDRIISLITFEYRIISVYHIWSRHEFQYSYWIISKSWFYFKKVPLRISGGENHNSSVNFNISENLDKININQVILGKIATTIIYIKWNFSGNGWTNNGKNLLPLNPMSTIQAYLILNCIVLMQT